MDDVLAEASTQHLTMHNQSKLTPSKSARIGKRWATTVVAVAVAAAAASSPVTAATPSDALNRWITRHAVPLHETDPSAPLDDLGVLRKVANSATIVGLGESVHGARQQTELKFRTLRVLVEQLGFRTIAWEEDWTTGFEIDRYVTTGRGDPDALVSEMTGQWQSRQTADALRWLREYNSGRPDKVRFLGVEYYYTGMLAYDAVDDYVASADPTRLKRLRRLLKAIEPTTEDKVAYATEYAELSSTEKARHLRDARGVYQMVRDIRHRPRDPAHELAVHHAQQILSFHEHYSLATNDQNIYREAHAAANLRWWQERTDHRVAYWAASAHTANASDVRMTMPGGTEFRFPAAGSYLARWYRRAYVSIGYTLDHGVVGIAPETFPLGRPDASWFERPLGQQRHAYFVLKVTDAGPSAVRAWLTRPLTTRGLPWAGPTATISGGTVVEWFDVLVHTQVVSPIDAPHGP